MPREAQIKWSIDKKRQEEGKACYRLSIPAQFSRTGKRQNVFFASKAKAVERATEIKRLRDEKGSSVFSITQQEASAILNFRNYLEGCESSLYDMLVVISKHIKTAKDFSDLNNILQIGIKAKKQQESSVSFAQAAKEMIVLKETILKRRPATIRQIQFTINSLAKKSLWFSNKKMSDISAEDCRKALNETFNTPILVDDGRRIISGVFTLGYKRGYCSTNPIKSLEPLHREEKEILPLSVAEVMSLFAACRPPTKEEVESCTDRRLKLDLTECLPAIAIMTFAGVRPTEVTRLKWADISFEEKVISIRGLNSKTGGTRHVTLCSALQAWLAPFKKSDNHAICPKEWRIKWEGVRLRAGWNKKNPWTSDSLRHTYASYHVKIHRNFPSLQVEMGHGSASLLRQRYSNLRGVTMEEAQKFWEIKPCSLC